ncbi:MAG: ATP-dependent Clp protease proteolytic subunit [Clostridiales bacterium]|jgi:ATP-dependent protease ClpP protease subunit|nr:ATP-dependent Clp protease proteolytic subunit [Clostridiales bacterium]
MGKNTISNKEEYEKDENKGDLGEQGNIKDISLISKTVENPRGNIQFLPIIGQVEGHIELSPQTKTTKYEHVIPLLIGVSQMEEIDGLMVILNTVGGDVEAGLAIAELISNLGKPTVSLVIGGGHSIGVPLAVSADYSFIAPSATMTIHPVRLSGTVIGAPQTFDYLTKIQDRVIDFIVSNTEITKAELSSLMLDSTKLALDIGTILVGGEAVEAKIINEVGGLKTAVEKLYNLIEENKKNKPGE